ncbi:MAG: pilus assembly protein [Anaerolineae bacterium]|jgi:hypothetical protein|nr:pilus assembly protein [Anaerolineae bacterium]MDH7473540.1 pilus assembly protein [Anaerolineae bacterium]
MEAKRTQPKNRGQSVVELALVLPIMLVIVVGLVEIGSILFTQMTVTNAAREGARFGVTGATDNDITLVAQNALATILKYEDTRVALYVIRGKTGSDGHFNTSSEDIRSASYWRVRQTISSTIPSTPVSATAIEQDLGHSPNVEVLIVQAFYDHDSLLGLPFVDFLARGAVLNSYTLMRMGSPNVRDVGCRVYPIAIHMNSINGRDPTTNMMNNILNGEAPGNFGWLRWPEDENWGDAPHLAQMLNDPSLSVTMYENPDDSSDIALNVGDKIWGNSGVSAASAVQTALTNLRNRYIRVPIWDSVEGTGINAKYHISGFAIVAITSWDLSGQDKISAKFIRLDSSCR